MADVLNPEQTESNPLNTELETPTLEAATEHAEPSIETTHNPEATSAETLETAHPVAVESEHVEDAPDLNSMEDFWRHEQLAARNRWASVASPAGPLDALKPPFNLSAFEARMDAVPALGEHTRAILEELGCSATEIDGLAREKAI